MKRYNDLPTWLQQRFGTRAYKVSLTANTTCPNIDGRLAKGGCTFCNDASYAPLGEERRTKTIAEQLREGVEYIGRRHYSPKCIAYFQSFTSTYGPREELLEKFRQALDHPAIVGMALSTRPDCLDRQWARDLSETLGDKLLWIEVGLQSSSNRTLARINRCHTAQQFAEAVRMWRNETTIPLCSHAILGLPGETKEDIVETARFLANLPVDGLKIHNLHVVKGTQLAQEFLAGQYRPLTLEEYVDWTIAFLEETPPPVVIHRLNAHAPRHLTLAPEWSVNKLAIVNAVEQEMEQRDSRQGKAIAGNQQLA